MSERSPPAAPSATADAAALGLRHLGAGLTPRLVVIGVIAFLTLVDLFAAQAILPALAAAYGVTPAAIGLAVNASTLGMAVSALAVALFGGGIDHRRGIATCLGLLAIPTALLAVAPDLWTFALLRVVQGVFMAAAFAFTVAYLADHGRPEETAAALAAYVTGNVASNLVGRLVAASLADHTGLPVTFLAFAVLNLAGAAAVLYYLDGMMRSAAADGRAAGVARPSGAEGVRAVARHLRNPRLLRAFAIGFLILFAFIGVFTYVNFVLIRPPLALSAAMLGVVYLVFVPAMVTTARAGVLETTFGLRGAFVVAFGSAILGTVLLLAPSPAVVLIGLALVGAGTFAAQALATAVTSRLAHEDRTAASGLYLAAYYAGGLVGSALLGLVFDRFGWPATVGVITAALVLATALAISLAASLGRPAAGR